jgi:hypothetical protein
MSDKVEYVVVENAGYEGECDVARFGTRWAADKYIERTYSANEIAILHVDVCMTQHDMRTYDPLGF